MIVLGIDSSTPVAGVAIIDKGKLLTENFLNTGYTHSEGLMAMINTALAQAKLKPQDLDGIAVTKGPGSFTGLRIGMVTAKTLAQVLEKKLISIPTLDVLAHNLWGHGGIICPILNARKHEVYTAFYEMAGQEMMRISDYFALSPNHLGTELKATGRDIKFLGDGVPIYKEILADILRDKAFWMPEPFLYPRAASLALLGLKELQLGKEDSYYTLEPLYLRKSEAEVRWEEKACPR